MDTPLFLQPRLDHCLDLWRNRPDLHNLQPDRFQQGLPLHLRPLKPRHQRHHHDVKRGLELAGARIRQDELVDEKSGILIHRFNRVGKELLALLVRPVVADATEEV